MSVLESTLDRKSERFAQNRAEMLETLTQLDALHEEGVPAFQAALPDLLATLLGVMAELDSEELVSALDAAVDEGAPLALTIALLNTDPFPVWVLGADGRRKA
jgi:hypothetical protein